MRPLLGRTAPKRFTRVTATVAITAALTAASWVAPLSGATAATNQAVIRAAHFSPTTPGVDVYLTPFSGGKATTAWLSNVSYGTVSAYQTLTPGLYTVAMRLAGTSSSAPPALSWVLDARAGAAYTIAGVGSGAAVRGVVIPDDLSNPPAGRGFVRVIQAASRAPAVTVSAVGGPVIASSAQFATVSSYASVPAGALDVTATSTTDPSLTADQSVDVKSGQITSILLLDAQTSGITMRALLDSAAAAAVPVGAVPAGAGGTARTVVSSGNPWQLVPVLGALGVLALVLLSLSTVSRQRRAWRPTGPERALAVRTLPEGRHHERVHGRHAAG